MTGEMSVLVPGKNDRDQKALEERDRRELAIALGVICFAGGVFASYWGPSGVIQDSRIARNQDDA